MIGQDDAQPTPEGLPLAEAYRAVETIAAAPDDPFAQIARLRRWLIGLTVAVVVLGLVACPLSWIVGGAGVALVATQAKPQDESGQIADAIRVAYGDTLGSVDVSLAKGDRSDPFTSAWEYRISYRLKGVDVDCRAVMSADSLGYSYSPLGEGFVPPLQTGRARMEPARFARLLSAYGEIADEPFLSLSPVTDGGVPIPSTDTDGREATTTVGERVYRVEDLWEVRPFRGRGSSEPRSLVEEVLTFYEDPSNGEFTLVTRESRVIDDPTAYLD